MIVAGVLVVRHEVVARDERRACQIRHAAHARVDDSDDDALALTQLPGIRQADLTQVPLVPVARIAGEALMLGSGAGAARLAPAAAKVWRTWRRLIVMVMVFPCRLKCTALCPSGPTRRKPPKPL